HADDDGGNAREQHNPPVLILRAPSERGRDVRDAVCYREPAEQERESQQRNSGMGEHDDSKQNPKQSAEQGGPPVARQRIREHKAPFPVFLYLHWGSFPLPRAGPLQLLRDAPLTSRSFDRDGIIGTVDADRQDEPTSKSSLRNSRAEPRTIP